MLPPPVGTVEVFTKQNLLVKAVHSAFYDHHPLILSPDVIWLTILQGLANHVDQNSKRLRRKFVNHEKKITIVIQKDDFVKGSCTNDWESIFPEFVDQIKANSKQHVLDFMPCDFSTSGAAEVVASHITLMDTVKHYFEYTATRGCGFPRITLSGKPEDWSKLRAKAEKLRPFELDCTVYPIYSNTYERPLRKTCQKI